MQPSSANFLNFEGKTPQKIFKLIFQYLKMIKFQEIYHFRAKFTQKNENNVENEIITYNYIVYIEYKYNYRI